MARQIRRAICAAAVVGLLACSTHYTTARSSGGATPIYKMSDARALEIAHRALVEAFPSRKVTHLEGPTWSFSTTYRLLLDTYSQQVLVVPMEGLAPDRSRVRGFVFDVSGSGTAIFTGSSKNRRLFKRVQELADATGTRILVTNATRVPFRPQGSEASQGDSSDVERRLRNLRDLLNQGLIAPEQFEAKQKEILGDL
jgi:hypothetical protein